MQDLAGPARIDEGDVVEHDIAVHRRLLRIRPVGLFFRVHDVAETLDGDARLAHLGNDSPQLPDRPHQHNVIGSHRDEAARGHGPVDTGIGAQRDDREDLQARQDVRRGPVGRHQLHEVDPEPGVVGVLLLEALPLVHFPAKGPDDPDTGEILLHDRGEPPLLGVHLLKGPADLYVEDQRVADDDWDKDRGA